MIKILPICRKLSFLQNILYLDFISRTIKNIRKNFQNFLLIQKKQRKQCI